jgi:hypothetical protein
MIKRVKYWCLVAVLDYIHTMLRSDEKRIESAAEKTGQDMKTGQDIK